MDSQSSASGQSLQNTLPEVDPANLQAVIVHQGAIFQAYEEQLTALQASSKPAVQPPQAASLTLTSIAATPCCEPFRMTLSEKFDCSVNQC